MESPKVRPVRRSIASCRTERGVQGSDNEAVHCQAQILFRLELEGRRNHLHAEVARRGKVFKEMGVMVGETAAVIRPHFRAGLTSVQFSIAQ